MTLLLKEATTVFWITDYLTDRAQFVQLCVCTGKTCYLIKQYQSIKILPHK